MCVNIYAYIKWRYVNVKIYCSSTPSYTKFSIWTLNCLSKNVHFKSTFNQQQILRSIFVNIWNRENSFIYKIIFNISASLQLENLYSSFSWTTADPLKSKNSHCLRSMCESSANAQFPNSSLITIHFQFTRKRKCTWLQKY